MARKSLKANLTKPDIGKATEVAKKLTAGQGDMPPPPNGATDYPEYETVSYNLPLDLIDLYRDLAAERHRRDQALKREWRRQNKEAKKQGLPIIDPPQARQSASALVREAMEAYRKTVEAELEQLRDA
jgi:hypothetical protein